MGIKDFELSFFFSATKIFLYMGGVDLESILLPPFILGEHTEKNYW